VDRDVLLHARVGLLPEVFGKLVEVDILDWLLFVVENVESIRQVLNANQNLIPLHRMHTESKLIDLIMRGIFLLNKLGERAMLLLLGSSCGNIFQIHLIKNVEHLHGLINKDLLAPLQGLRSLEVEDLHEVLGVDSEAEAVRVCLVQGLYYTLCIVVGGSSVLHEFNSVVAQDGRSTLWSIIKDSDL